ncbi:hypothetical protein XHV734_1230 [Xanthomonas hortorum pv. vitians]|nr:hypothetical protein XHV734_1230 [Xanthomonas hortorum pv. vitians]
MAGKFAAEILTESKAVSASSERDLVSALSAALGDEKGVASEVRSKPPPYGSVMSWRILRAAGTNPCIADSLCILRRDRVRK